MQQQVVVVGAGHLGRIHARLLSQVEGARLAAIVDPNPNTLRAAAEQFSVPAFESLERCKLGFDAAIIASPTPCHYRTAMELLAKRKHLLVEKPLAVTGAHAQEMVVAARQAGVVLQVGHVERFNPAWIAAADLTAKPKYIEAVRASRFPGRCLDVGVVMDLMIHDLDLVLSLTSAPLREVQASGLAVITDDEDLAEARLVFECGLVASLKASRISPAASRQMQVYSEHGYAAIDFNGPAVTMIRPRAELLERSFYLEEATANPLQFADVLFDEWLPVQVPEIPKRNAILDELHDFVISIRSGTQPTVGGEAGSRAVEIAEAILAAIDTRCWTRESALAQRGPLAMPPEDITAASRRQHQQRPAA